MFIRRREIIVDVNTTTKIHNISLDTSHSTRNLGFIFDVHLIFPDQITSFSKACYYHIRQLRYSGLTLIRQLPLPLLPLSSSPNLITVILSTIDSLSLNYPIQQIQNSLVRTVVKAPKSCHYHSHPTLSPLAQDH